MLWIHCGLVVVVVAATLFDFVPAASVASKREADYTLDDSFWIEESPAGEVERLLREYTQNQEMVRNIGTHYYQIIYPVQLRQHKKMGISTREIGAPKRGQSDGGYQGRGRQRTGKHFHRTSLLIKAFNHKFRLDLELNTQLLAPNIMQKHFLTNGAEQVSKQEIEHCYYHGTVQDYPGATAAFHTCNGVSGVIHVGNETFVIHPFYGGDLSKHPHVIFEARAKANKGCANSPLKNSELKDSAQNPYAGFLPTAHQRFKRDVRTATKYIETALVIDKTMFEKRNGSTRTEVVHDSIQVANIVDLYFRTLNTRVSVVYIETWQGGNQAQIDRTKDIETALRNFNDYTTRQLYRIDKDTTQLLTGEVFTGGEAGISNPLSVCTAKAVGVSVDINTYEPHLLAGTTAHMIGHNIGMGHDDGREECHCKDWHGCIMAQAIVGLDNVQPYKFSECSRSDYVDKLRIGTGICLLNKPNELEIRRTCGNRLVEEGEDCDCGTIDECPTVDPCCDPITCKLTKEAECAAGPCCHKCKLRDKGVPCRPSKNECDLTEHCSGDAGGCPTDVYKKNGYPCAENTGVCFNGVCPTFAIQCEAIWGYGGVLADNECFDQYNSKGSISGHCGSDTKGAYIKCDPKNVKCGSLQCQHGSRQPVLTGLDQLFTRTIVSIKGIEYECKSTSAAVDKYDLPPLGLVRDGTVCGDNLICFNQSCTSIHSHLDDTKCASNHNDLECSGHGVCTNTNKCYCEIGWSGTDCSIEVEVTPPPPDATPPPDAPKHISNLADIMRKKETPYGPNSDNLSTIWMVIILVGVVKGVFVCFAVVAVCYRKSTVRKYEKPYKKAIQKNYVHATGNHSQEDSLDNSSKIVGSIGSFREIPSQKMTRPMAGSGSEDDITHSGNIPMRILPHAEIVPLILEKKGILKKQGYGLIGPMDNKEEWEAAAAQIGPGGPSMSEVERTLKNLNGYHEDILQALRKAAIQRKIRDVISGDPSGSSAILSDEVLRRSLQDCYTDYKRSSSQEKVCEPEVVVEPEEEEEEDEVPPCGPIRIRNLEDLIRQLEHHSRHMSPSGSEDIRMSETEADRHYRQESSSACSESSHQSHRDSRFVYGRYRQPTGRLPYPNPHHQPEEESIYESADHDRGMPCGDTPDSESSTTISPVGE